MPFDPAQPADHSTLTAQVVRDQLNALKGIMDAIPAAITAAVNAAVAAALAGTSSNTNNVDSLGMMVSDPPTQSELQLATNKIDELITALRR